MQLQEILLWATHYADLCKETRVAFEKDEIELYKKLFLMSRKQYKETEKESEEELYSRHPEFARLLPILKDRVSDEVS